MNSLKMWLKVSGLLLLPFAFFQCQDDDTVTDPNTGGAQLQFTDAPSDDSSVKGVFVTIAEVRIDGEVPEGWDSRQTIDLMAYQNGDVAIYGTTTQEAGTYGNLTIVLDTETDAEGNNPGCYVLRDDDSKERLEGNGDGTVEIDVSGGFDIFVGTLRDIVVDVDLRKSVRYENKSEKTFQFATEAELQNSVRLTPRDRSGSVLGQCTNYNSFDDKLVIAYAYEAGTYNEATETSVQGDSEIRFANAVTSTQVNADGSFNLSFLPEGDYEVVFAAFDDPDQDGSYTFEGHFSLGLVGDLTLSSVSVSANAQAALAVNLFAIIP